VVQEALNNVIRHSAAPKAWVRIKQNGDVLQIDVEDHGAGLPFHSARTGIGLVAMRERAGLLDGRLEFLKPAEGGTLVRLTVPVKALESDEAKNISSISGRS